MYQIEVCTDEAAWDDYVLEAGGHPLQLSGWGSLKARHNWRVERVLVKQGKETIGGAQLLIRPLPTPLRCLAYIPRGPFAHAGQESAVLGALSDYAKRSLKAICLTIEPHWHTWPEVAGWRKSTNTILIPRTLILDLKKSEEDLQAAMTKKTRQYIRKSLKEGIEIRQVKDEAGLADVLRIYHETAERAGFPLHDDRYYQDAYALLSEHGPIFAAYHEGEMVAFVWLTISSTIAFELYGGMNETGQRLRANYALKWHAIKTTKQWGLSEYDMNGLLNDGVSTFKQGFADHEDLLVGTYDQPLSPLYLLWDKGLPYAKRLLRTLRKR